jgi:hypothetical protein
MPPPASSFWHHYLRQHARPATRALHYAGTVAATAAAVAAVALRSPRLALAAAVAGYAPAWAAHALIERNRPATFAAPVRSLVSDYRMLLCWAAGTLPRELAAAGVR